MTAEGGGWRVDSRDARTARLFEVANPGLEVDCVHGAPSADLIREHTRQGGFPADRISEVKSIIDPTTAEA